MAAPLLVVDSPSMLYRAFFALPKTIRGSEGQAVNALLGTANLVLREVERYEPRAVVMCFGPDAAAYRTELYPGYHADRPEIPEELEPQFAAARGLFSDFGWVIADNQEYEADDLLGTLAAIETEAGGDTLVMTGDRDLFQCANESVSILYVSTGGSQGADLMGPADVTDRYGIDPGLVPDFIALRGDPSDGLPGAKGVGEKKAAALLNSHGSLEGVLDAAAEQTPALSRALIDGREEILAFREIATLRTLEMERPPDGPLDRAGAAKAAREMGMGRLATRLEEGTAPAT